jgi:predicted ATP-grasp superfamily ATP-dependent carboligase
VINVHRHHQEREIPDSLDLIVSMDGWIDSGYSAATSAKALLDNATSETIYSFDVGDLLDNRTRRPRVKIVNGLITSLSWVQPVIKLCRDRNSKQVLLLTGPEPDLRWKDFALEILEIVKRHKVRYIIGLGAFPFTWPHTRPIKIIATGSDMDLVDKIGYLGGEIDAPASVVDVIGKFCQDSGTEAKFVNLWAQVPHYVANIYYPQAALALLDTLIQLCGLEINLDPLRQEALDLSAQLDNLISASDEHFDMVRNLEEQVDLGSGTRNWNYEDIPSGDEIAAELERYLRGENNI